jgi:threonine dehydrogenase-like Zn-dependent dehydrogenase
MRAAIFQGPGRIAVGERPDPVIGAPTDAVVRVLARQINPGRVLDFETGLDGIADAYAAMDERRAVKALIRMPSGT